jgi:hypothetical protein
VSSVARTLRIVDNRGAWSTAGGVLFGASLGSAVTLAVAAAPARSGVASWPAYVFGGIALLGLYLLVAPLARSWPFARPGSAAEVIDRCIRAGREARERITYERLAPLRAAGEAAEWTLRTANLLHDYYPAAADRFVLASGDESSFSGQALLIQTINAKLTVLTDARTGLT